MGLPGSPGINFSLVGYLLLWTSLNIHCQYFSLSLTFSVFISSLIIFLLIIVAVFLFICSYFQSGYFLILVPRSFLQFSSATQSCLTFCDPMDCSPPGLPVHHQLPELAQTHVHWVGWCHRTISSSVVPFSCLQTFPASGSFPMSQFFASDGQSIGVSASTSVLPINIQDWFPLGWTGWISLHSKGLWKVFSNTTVQKHQFFCAKLSLYSKSHIHTWLLEIL